MKKNDTIKKLDSMVSPNALFVIDGQPSKNKLGGIDPNDILSIDILKEGKGSATFEPVNDIVVVVTKANAIKQYQKKFSSFSNQYKEFLDQHHDDDKGFLYIINGVPLNHSGSYIKQLYNLSKDNILEVDFQKEEPNEDEITAMIIIRTKK